MEKEKRDDSDDDDEDDDGGDDKTIVYLWLLATSSISNCCWLQPLSVFVCYLHGVLHSHQFSINTQSSVMPLAYFTFIVVSPPPPPALSSSSSSSTCNVTSIISLFEHKVCGVCAALHTKGKKNDRPKLAGWFCASAEQTTQHHIDTVKYKVINSFLLRLVTLSSAFLLQLRCN